MKYLLLSIVVLVMVGCNIEKSKKLDAELETVKLENAKYEGLREERNRWMDWKSAQVSANAQIIRNYQSKVRNEPDCCEKAKLIVQEALDMLDLWKTDPIPK